MNKTCLFFILFFFFYSCKNEKREVLLIGDSIALGYFPHLKSELNDIANLRSIGVNARDTKYGKDNIHSWLSTCGWDIIVLNFGLWDLTYRLEEDSDATGKKDKVFGSLTTPLNEYGKNLQEIVNSIKPHTENIVFITTSYIPEEEPGMFADDVHKYNEVAMKVMHENNIPVFDIYLASTKIHSNQGLGVNDVHYSKRGYKMIADSLEPYFRHFIESKLLQQ